MKLKLFILILFLSPLLSAAQTYTHPNIEKSVFQIYRVSDIDLFGVGTIFYIGDNRFVTNAHVIYTEKTMNNLLNFYHEFAEANGIISEQNKRKIINHQFLSEKISEKISDSLFIQYKNYPIPVKKITAINFEDDIAILEIDKNQSKNMDDLIPLEIAPFSENITSKKGGSIYGFPSNESTSFSKFILQEMRFKNILFYNGGNFFATYVNYNNLNGASGSPVLIDGKVVGVFKAADENDTRSTPSTSLIELLATKKTLSIIKTRDLYPLFLSFIEKTKMNPEKNINAITFLHTLQANSDDRNFYLKYMRKAADFCKSLFKNI